MTLEAQDRLKNTTIPLPDTERKFCELPPYKKNGFIPGWAEVIGYCQLSNFDPRELRLLRGYYRAQRKIAEGSTKRASRIFRGLDNNQDFRELENREGRLLSEIASFVRGQTEKQRSKIANY
ncbi:MAG: hypothetical protein M1575_01700 [Patescibacteria group bacterium]|nr:hypothetical protein [Patescibacteria group bacterium]MCL5095416.1 hypothetical protein [Patescibacteria group bacterium]